MTSSFATFTRQTDTEAIQALWQAGLRLMVGHRAKAAAGDCERAAIKIFQKI